MLLTAELMQKMLRFSQTNYCRATAYYAQMNGLIECFNKMLANMFAIYVDIKQDMECQPPLMTLF